MTKPAPLRHALACFLLATTPLAAFAVETETEPAAAPAAAKPAPAKRAEPQTIALAEGALAIKAPAAWKQVEPRNRIIEVELVVPPPADDQALAELEPARLTVMPAGGSVEQNIARWIGQFRGAGGGAVREQAKIEELEVRGMQVHTVEIAGTYLDAPRGPFGPTEEKPEHRLLGAIVLSKDAGNYFIKMTGPDAVVAAARPEFVELVGSITKQKPAG
ncbi:hypothetical protein Pla175_40500 [Pirellulimonas nuda]|uniref:PsbP C-terminal domain-containing protein n=1 Tax=Pirellulimonas nuda TaxID=2528009 RepID=A0A518DGN9_9BACT|nr:hypothetical protein [Pirellulimonas nuda]QDU90641.1 hypothetical protein Pla175_40500 [Pirellulimonas nuda]